MQLKRNMFNYNNKNDINKSINKSQALLRQSNGFFFISTIIHDVSSLYYYMNNYAAQKLDNVIHVNSGKGTRKCEKFGKNRKNSGKMRKNVKKTPFPSSSTATIVLTKQNT